MKPSSAACAALLLLCLMLPFAGEAGQRPVSAPSPADRIARIERSLLPVTRVKGRTYLPVTLEARMKERDVPAVSIALIRGGAIEWAKAYGLADVASKRPATTETLFQAASISKPVAATVALQLVQEGKLQLDADVNAKLSSWKVPSSALTAKKPVSLRGLLSHSAGLTVHGFRGYAAGSPIPSLVQILDGDEPANTAPVIVDIEPGSAFRYSGGGYTVMQLLLGDITGQAFPQLMRERVLGPAAMTSSTYDQTLPEGMAERVAVGYLNGGEPIAGGHVRHPEMAAAGLWTTPSDLARWLIAVQRAHAGARGGILSPEMAREMLTKQKGDWGLGPMLEGEGDDLRFGHGGSNQGFRAYMTSFVDRGEGVVIMTNSDNGATVATELLQAVAREYGWPGFEAKEIVPIALSPQVLREYSGTFTLEGRPIRIAVETGDGVLFATAQNGERVELVPTGVDTFAISSSGAPVRFERGQDGKVVALFAFGSRLVRAP